MKYREMIEGAGPILVGVAGVVLVLFLFMQPSQTSVVEVEKHEVKAHLNEKAAASGVTVLPLTLMEDSRCPLDVQCIQAGTVRVQVQIISGMGPSVMVMELGTSVTTEAEEITLVGVTPAPRAGISPAASDYVFSFNIKKRDLGVQP